jgi:tRNA(fMet)-specific endonuclease VapC
VTYLLDTNVVIALLGNRPPLVRTRFRQTVASGEAIALSSIVLFELWYGVARSQRRQENEERLRVFLSADIGVLPFDIEDAEISGDIRGALQRVGTPIGPYDLLIAGQAVRTGSTLITANAREFARVPGLDWQDWSAKAN